MSDVAGSLLVLAGVLFHHCTALHCIAPTIAPVSWRSSAPAVRACSSACSAEGARLTMLATPASTTSSTSVILTCEPPDRRPPEWRTAAARSGSRAMSAAVLTLLLAGQGGGWGWPGLRGRASRAVYAAASPLRLPAMLWVAELAGWTPLRRSSSGREPEGDRGSRISGTVAASAVEACRGYGEIDREPVDRARGHGGQHSSGTLQRAAAATCQLPRQAAARHRSNGWLVGRE